MKTRNMGPVRNQEVFRLPGIHINNRISNPSNHAGTVDPRRAHPVSTIPGGPPTGEHQWNSSQHQFLHPPPRHNDFMVSEGQGGMEGVTYYQERSPPFNQNGPTRRQQSLPVQKADVLEKKQQSRSAPGHRKLRSQGLKGPLTTLNTLVARSRGPEGETNHIVTTNFAGMSTKDHEASSTRYTRFASTWAQVRAENHIDMCALSQENTSKKANQEAESKDYPPSRRSKADPGTSSPSQDKEIARPAGRKDPAGTSAKTSVFKPPSKPSPEGRERQTIRFKTDDEEDENQSDHTQQDTPSTQNRTADPKRTKSSRNHKRPQWDNRLTLSVPADKTETTVKSWRRYEAELTHVPAVSTSEQLFKAYTGQAKQTRSKEQRDEVHEEGPERRPSTHGSQPVECSGESKQPGDRSGSRSPPREYVLSRNEAKMYLHLQNVYGSEEFRQQRKEQFFKKLTEIQLQDLQLQAADSKRRQQQRQESKQRQRKQLIRVRNKFRREQRHRFRTQYVTSRVLGYEKGDRDLYGLPNDWHSDEDELGLEDVEDSEQDDSKVEIVGKRDASRNVSSKKSTETVTKQDRTDFPVNRAGEDSQKIVAPIKSKHTLPETAPSSSEKTPNSESSPQARDRDKTNSKGSKTATSKDNALKNDDSGFQSPADASAAGPTASKNSMHRTSGDQAGKSLAPQTGKPTASQPTTSVIKASTNDTHRSTKRTDIAMDGHNASGNVAKNSQHVSGQTIDTVTVNGPYSKNNNNNNNNNNIVSAITQNSRVNRNSESVKKVTSKVVVSIGSDRNHSKIESASPAKDPLAITERTAAGDQSKASGLHPTTSNPPHPNQDSTQNQSADTNSASAEKKDADNNPSQKNEAGQKNKKDYSRAENADNNSNNRANKDNKTSSKDDRVSNKDSNRGKEENVVYKTKDDSPDDKDRQATTSNSSKTTATTTSNSSKTTPFTTNTTNNTKASPSPWTASTVSGNQGAVHGHASDIPRKSGSTPNTKPTSSATGDNIKSTSSTTRNNTKPTSTTTRGNKSQAADRQEDSRGRKRKSMQSQPRSLAERKQQLERKYGKLFEVKTGPTWNPGAKPPKMEGIDTVVVRVTDDKGRTRLKKQEVTDVLKEAKDQLALADRETRRRSADKGGNTHKMSPNHIRPASADTLDFDDDDEDDEDVFERMRRKYKLQIDSDDDLSIG